MLGETMTNREFCYWLQGLFELRRGDAVFSPEQLRKLRNHVNLVKHVEGTLAPFPAKVEKMLDAVDRGFALDAATMAAIKRSLDRQFEHLVTQEPAPVAIVSGSASPASPSVAPAAPKSELAALITKLRASTGASVMECKRALEQAGGDVEKAAALLAPEPERPAPAQSSVDDLLSRYFRDDDSEPRGVGC